MRLIEFTDEQGTIRYKNEQGVIVDDATVELWRKIIKESEQRTRESEEAIQFLQSLLSKTNNENN
jgi:hypothetical protein